MATLTIVDDEDETGATATIAGSAGAANVVTVYRWPTAVGQFAQVDAYPLVGDGDVDLDTGVGSFLALLTSDGLPSAAPQTFTATDGVDAIWWRILQKVVDKIASLPLPGLDASDIWAAKQTTPDFGKTSKGVVVVPVAEVIDENRNRTTDLGLGNLVTCYQAGNQNLTSLIGRQLKWREVIQQAFEIKPGYMPISDDLLINVGNEVATDRVFSPAAFLVNYDAAAIVIRTTIRRPR